MGLCRSASGSHPAPVPRCCGGAARMEGRALPASYVRSGAGSVCQPDSGKSLPKVRGQQTRSGHGTGGSSARTGLSLSPVHGGGKGRVSLLGFRSMAGSSPAQRTVWTNPALWSATNQENFCFLRARAGDGAGILCGRRAARAHFRTVARARGIALESGEKKGRGEGRGRAVTVGGMVPADRQGCRIGPRRKRRLSRRGCAGRQHAGKGDVLRVCSSEATQSIGMSRADGSLHTCNDWGPCRRLQKLFPQ